MIFNGLKEQIRKNDVLFYRIKYIKYLINTNKINKFSVEDKKKYLDNNFYKIFGYHIDWQNPQTLSEKIQCLKFENENYKIMAKLADKYEVRSWVKDKIGDEYLIPLLGVYDTFEEIDFDKLPNSFVIKCNHDSGSVTLVKNKKDIDLKKLRSKYNFHLKTDFSKFTLESHYSLIKPKILIEKYIENEGEEAEDYKFWCFDSKAYYCRVDYDRHSIHKRNTYDLNWKLQDWTEGKYEQKQDGKRPENFSKMIEIVEKLSNGFPEVRVDLYNIKGKIYFGEMTFTSGSGLEYIDRDINLYLGSLWK